MDYKKIYKAGRMITAAGVGWTGGMLLNAGTRVFDYFGWKFGIAVALIFVGLTIVYSSKNKIKAEELIYSKVCPNCGLSLASDCKKCPKCGTETE